MRIRRRVIESIAGAWLFLLPLPSSRAQGPRELTLPRPLAQLEEEFTSIGSVRELRDGRVVITDSREGRIVLAELGSGTVRQVGRKGRGPNEYENVGRLLALAGDSSLLVDAAARRWLLLAGGEIVITIPPDAPLLKAMQGFARGSDERGHLWTTASARPFDQKTARPGTITFGAADSDYVVRGHRGTARLDTIARVRLAIARRTVIANAAGEFQGVSYQSGPLAVGEEAALFPDGWFAVARLDPFRVDWVNSEGKVIHGPAIPVTPLRVTNAEKEAYLARQSTGRTLNARVPEWIQRDRDALREQFPEYFPPFLSGLIAGGDGNLWLRQPLSLKYPDPRYLIVDRRGRLIGILKLGKTERLVSVSRNAVYVAWKDPDDVERLRRHALPY